jgi:non-specific serine/threonine protein kinase
MVTTNLPNPLTSFIGRGKELKGLKERLGGARLVTLAGAGGSGKTRLAIQVARDLLEKYKDGVWWVELGGLQDESLVPQAVAKALGVTETPNQSLTETLTNHLRAKHLLLVMDNCEHLIGACARLAETLLSASAGLRILATSREALGILGENVFQVPTLATPETSSAAQDLMQYESVCLFIERAQAVKADFGLTAQNASAIAEVCRRLDGIPLALELAAARVKVLKVENIAARLDDRFNLLTTGNRAALPRQQTLRATIDWSYDLLPEAARVLFRRLSVFAGGFTVNAAEQICSDESLPPPAVLEILARLVDRSLVIVELGRAEERYRQLETIREYAREKLIDSNEADQLRRRHFDFFLQWVESYVPALWGAAEQVWLDRLEAEQDNLRAALQWSLERGDHEQTLRLAGMLGWFWYVRSNVIEGRRWLDQALAHCDNCAPAVRAKGLNRAGTLAVLQGDYVRASEFLSAALPLYEVLGNSSERAWTLQQLSNVALFRGNYAQAMATAQESLRLSEQMGRRDFIASLQLYAGIIAYYQGDDAQAIELIEQGLPVLQEFRDGVAVARAFHTLALVARRRGGLAEARALFEKSLNVAQEKGSRLDVARAFEGLAGVACAQGQSERAVRLFGAAETARQVIGAPLPTGIRMDYDRDLAMTRSQLDTSTFGEAWAAGRRMTLEQAAEYARATTVEQEPPRRPRQAAKELYDGLSARERQVATLIAQGKTNREIAVELVVGERTVESHVSNVLARLGFTSRSQIAAWATEKGLTKSR